MQAQELSFKHRTDLGETEGCKEEKLFGIVSKPYVLPDLSIEELLCKSSHEVFKFSILVEIKKVKICNSNV